MDQQLARRRRTIERQRALFSVDRGLTAIDPFVQDSWRRCAPSLTPDQVAAPLDEASVADRWDASLIRRTAPHLVDELRSIARDGDLVAAVTDAFGRILWSFGGRTMRTHAEAVNFAIGGFWDESSAGTNAVSLSLINRRPFSVFSAEHWCAGVQDWVCYAAPVRDASGRAIGAIDLSSTWDRTSPLGLPTVTALARVVEQQIRLDAQMAAAGAGRSRRRHPAPPRWSASRLPQATLLEIDVLGRAAVRLDGHPVLLTPRQVEVLTVLACAGGLTLDELHTRLHGERRVSLTTTKVEVSRLRSALGDGVVGSRPYRLRVPVEVDVQRLVDRHDPPPSRHPARQAPGRRGAPRRAAAPAARGGAGDDPPGRHRRLQRVLAAARGRAGLRRGCAVGGARGRTPAGRHGGDRRGRALGAPPGAGAGPETGAGALDPAVGPGKTRLRQRRCAVADGLQGGVHGVLSFQLSTP